MEKKHELTMFRLKFSFDGLLYEILKIDQIKVRLSVFRILRKLDLYFVYSKNQVLSRLIIGIRSRKYLFPFMI